ncbi:MAG: hypothetical protein EOO89_06360 [Pedobacter sp.]|nr:MAG: hypothetical protein EOO89_06360 [Pedobacter sp.]
MGAFTNGAKEGDQVTIVLNRKNAEGKMELVTATQPAVMVQRAELNKLEFMKDATPEQLAIRKVWLNN